MKIGILADCFGLGFEEGIKKAAEMKVDGVQLYAVEGELAPENMSAEKRVWARNLVKENGAQGLVLFMQQFCDPEEMEYPCLKKALDDAGIPHIKLGVDQQMRDFGQASTAIQAFADVL